MVSLRLSDIIDVIKSVIPSIRIGDPEMADPAVKNYETYGLFYDKTTNYLMGKDSENHPELKSRVIKYKIQELNSYLKTLLGSIVTNLSTCAQQTKNLVGFKHRAPEVLLTCICKYVNDDTENVNDDTEKKSKKTYFENTLYFEYLISELENWSQRTYEGSRVDLSFCISEQTQQSSVNKVFFAKVIRDDFIAVLSEFGQTTIKLDRHGNIVEHIQAKAGTREAYHCINSMVNLCNTANKACIISLLSNGEIVIIRDRRLIFAKRRGQWRAFDITVIKETRKKLDISTKNFEEVLYSLLLDVSFAGTGGTLAVINKTREEIINSIKTNVKDDIVSLFIKIVNRNDIYDLELKDAMKASRKDVKLNKRAALRSLLGFADYNKNTPYEPNNIMKMSRKLREEMLGIDGATIIDKLGNVLAVGAIVAVEGGSESGGRLAATKSLARLGFAAKISADGEIKGFVKDGTKENGIFEQFILG